mmetsp:Transcript_4028/g.11628  ORF Transcript_4028/g.11628 Transcript_4028/m.11628 type:complete len:293 (-) Transcript_4028:54-932(-)
MVPRRDLRGPNGRAEPGQGLHGDPPVGHGGVGRAQGRAQPPHQGVRRAERLLPPLHPHVVPVQGGRARRRLRQGVRGGDTPPADGVGRRADPGPRRQARRAPRRPPDVGDHHLGDVPPVDHVPPRPAAQDQPVGQRGAVGDEDPALPALLGVPLAGGPHGARDGRVRAVVRPPDARRLPPHVRGAAGGADGAGGQVAVGAVRGGGRDVHGGGADAERLGAAERHQSRAGPELRAGLWSLLPDRGPEARAGVGHVLGRLHAARRRPRHDPLRRHGPVAAAGRGARPGRAGACG